MKRREFRGMRDLGPSAGSALGDGRCSGINRESDIT